MRFLKHALAAVLVSATALLALPVPAQAHALDDGFGLKVHSSHKGVCLSAKVPVAPAPDQARNWRVQLTLCQPFRVTREVDVLTHGATYIGSSPTDTDASYWDWPQNPSLYSYVGKTLADGRATLAYDRIGSGRSTRPLSTEITMASDAFVLHQLVNVLKALGYNQINSISHSYGSGVALQEAVSYNDVNALVLTGYLHRPSNPAVTAGNYPANMDPKFATAGLDNGYLTSRPGVRGTSFHSPTSDPAVVAYDEEQKDLVSLTGLLGFLGARGVPAATNISNLVKVPVLVINGQQDAIFCYQPAVFNCADAVTLTNNEAPYYSHAAALVVVAIEDSGHDLTLHPSADTSYEVINSWLATN
jgi:pimeloyl-ACP methyl ester carboxylesterase